MMSFLEIQERCELHTKEVARQNPDPSHDFLHVKRVVATAQKLAKLEGADLNIVIPAAYLHDCVYIPKTDPRRKLASRISADKAVELLTSWNYPLEYFSGIHHAILSHSFSAGIPPETIEARIVQDADRLDAIGAIGIYRCFALSGVLKTPLYEPVDPFCDLREPNDSTNALDHFFVKLLWLPEKLQTNSAKVEGARRLEYMKLYLEALKSEIY